jgi:hypothetical protein
MHLRLVFLNKQLELLILLGMSLFEGLRPLFSLQLVVLSEGQSSLQVILDSLVSLVSLFIDPRQVRNLNLS